MFHLRIGNLLHINNHIQHLGNKTLDDWWDYNTRWSYRIPTNFLDDRRYWRGVGQEKSLYSCLGWALAEFQREVQAKKKTR